MDDFQLTRRKALAALGTIGVASAGAGLGTSAYFSDQETFENNRLVAGTLDMKVAATEYYSDWSLDEDEYAEMASNEASTDIRLPAGTEQTDAQAIALDLDDDYSGNGDVYAAFFDTLSTDENGTPYNRVNGGISAATDDGLCGDTPEADADGPMSIDISDVKPGDFGGAQFAFELCDNPGYVWLTGGLDAASEGGVTEPEGDDSDEESGVVELLDEIQVAYGVGPINGGSSAFESTDSDDDGFGPVEQYTLREFLAILDGGGIALDGNVNAEAGGGTGAQGCFSGSPGEGSTVHQVSVVWWLPIDHGNQVQSDSVTFDLGFYTEQCRHNAGETELVAYYPFENSADDLSGNGYDGSITNQGTYIGGRTGRAVAFGGTNGYVNVSDSSGLDGFSGVTISAWFRLDGEGDTPANTLVRKNNAYLLQRTSGDYISFAVWDGGLADWKAVRTRTFDANDYGTWHHIAGVFDPDDSAYRLYLDGTEVDSATTTATAVDGSSAPLTIGGLEDQYSLDGALDDVRIYARALSASEVQSLYDSA
jgi:predicted ribosomally synthesized peptide with SipW-like signal peptide